MLVLAESCILFAGVVSRYAFDSPIIWTDELATFLFLWMAMFGAVVAVRRGGHMRLTTFIEWVAPNVRSWLATVAELVHNLSSQGLRFAPAASGDESSYTALHRALVTYAYRLRQLPNGHIAREALHLKSVPDDEADPQDSVDGLPVPQLASRDGR